MLDYNNFLRKKQFFGSRVFNGYTSFPSGYLGEGGRILLEREFYVLLVFPYQGNSRFPICGTIVWFVFVDGDFLGVSRHEDYLARYML